MRFRTQVASVLFAALLGSALSVCGVAQGAQVTAAPRWDVRFIPLPANFSVGTAAETGNTMEFVFTDTGGSPWSGPVNIVVKLPAGVTAEAVGRGNPWTSECAPASGGSEVVCALAEIHSQNAALPIRVGVSNAAAETVTTEISVSGGGAPPVTKLVSNRISSEKAPFAITEFESGATGAAGEPDVVAASHPTLYNTVLASPTETTINLGEVARQQHAPIKNDKDLFVDLPPGFVGNPTAAPKCPIRVFLSERSVLSHCPPASQVGSFAISGNAEVYMGTGTGSDGRNPIFNLEPEFGYPAEFGFYDKGLSHGVVVPAMLAHTSEGYVVRVASPELVTGLFGPYFLQTSFFGNPLRAAGQPGAGAAFLTNPSDCSAPVARTDLHLDLWSDPAPVAQKADGSRSYAATEFGDPRWYSASSAAPGVGECEALHFNPTLALKPSATAADSPSGLDVKIVVPQSEEPEGLATPPLRDVTVTLPPGLVVNPSSAEGLAGCSESQLAPESVSPGACPDASKLGTVTVETPLIEHRLAGSVYLGSPECAPCTAEDARSGRLLRLYIEINDPSTGVVIKLPGQVVADPSNGQLSAVFAENPQLPFESIELQLRSGPRAPLTTPTTCGEFTTATDLKPWSAPESGPDATPASRFGISSGPGGAACPLGEVSLANAPSFEAGTVTPLAGTYSPFLLKVSRENGSQRISSIEATLPSGLTGKLVGIPYCSNEAIRSASGRSGRDEQSNPSCPLASEVGTVTVGAGSGTPFYVQGHAYLAGPYKGAPISLEIITPAVAGPFDLGTVAVRTALYVNEYSAQIHAVSDPIPSILAGIPLDLRSIALNLNRPRFALNPTSCNASGVLGGATSTFGQFAALQSRFQVGGCKGLEFKPKISLSLKGGTKRTSHPALKAVVTYPKQGAYANIARAQVSLPHSEFLDQGNIAQACTKTNLTASACTAKSIYGKAKAWTPLLEKPLEGPVYLVGGYGYKLPALVAELNGQIRILLVGKIDTGKSRGIRNTFEAVPDAPVEKFVLEMKGGKKYGLLENSENLCKKKQVAAASFRAQNAAVANLSVGIATSCRHKPKRKTAKSTGK